MTDNLWTYSRNIYESTAYQNIGKYKTSYSHSKVFDVNNLYKVIYSLNSLLHFDSLTNKILYKLPRNITLLFFSF